MKMHGLVPYYRRRVGENRVRIYLRDAEGRTAGTLECNDATAKLLKPGRSYTFDKRDGRSKVFEKTPLSS